jgi:hypothetical protein
VYRLCGLLTNTALVVCCCCRVRRCYSQEDCASFLKTCPFSDDTKKGNSLADCLPDKSDFKKAACSAEAKGKIKSTDGQGVPLAANVTCFASEKVTCEIYKNATGHGFITAACKGAPAKKASEAKVPVAALWQCCLLLGLLVSDTTGGL